VSAFSKPTKFGRNFVCLSDHPPQARVADVGKWQAQQTRTAFPVTNADRAMCMTDNPKSAQALDVPSGRYTTDWLAKVWRPSIVSWQHYETEED
jgi:hypothetical protein